MKENNNEEYYSPASTFRKSNTLIRGRYSAGLLENKLLSVSLANARNTENNRLVATLSKSQIKKLLGTESHRYYEQLKLSANRLLGSVIFAEDPQNKKFCASVLVTDVKWNTDETGQFEVIFNETFRDQILDLKTNYTTFNIDCIFRLDTTGSYRLYETLLSHCYYAKEFKGEKTGKFDIEFGISELRCLMNLVDLSREEFSQFFVGNQNPDYDKIVQYAYYLHEEDVKKNKPKKDIYQAPKYKMFAELQRKILNPAVEEISEKTDLFVKYDVVRAGKGGKASSIIFHVIDKKYITEEETEKEVAVDIDELIDEVRALITENLSTKQIRAIINAAGNDIEKIKKAYDIAKMKDRDDIVGFMIAAIKADYQKPVTSKKKVKNAFHFENQREYDFDEIEKILLNR